MKNILNILVGILLSVSVLGQTDVNEIKKEFYILYEAHLDSIKSSKTVYERLSSLCMYHLNYCVNRGSISHFEDTDSTMYSAKKRFLHFFPNMDEEVYQIGEVMSYSNYSSLKTNKEVARRIFYGYMNSKGHRRIMEDKRFTYYNFEFVIVPGNDVYSIGFLTSVKVK